jgi:small redox-active disulfide protein 2
MKTITLFGANCGKCNKTEKRIRSLINDHNLDVYFEKIGDPERMTSNNILYLPSVMIDGKIIFRGIVPSEQELLKKIK